MGNVLAAGVGAGAAAGGDNAALFYAMATGENRNMLIVLAVMMGLGESPAVPAALHASLCLTRVWRAGGREGGRAGLVHDGGGAQRHQRA